MQQKQLENGKGRRFFRRAAIAAAATVIGVWASFTPLASSAQGAQRSQQNSKSISLQASKVPASKKTIAFSDAQKEKQKRKEAQVGGNEPPVQKFDSTHPYAGVRRILIELADQPDEAQKLACMYALAVDSIALLIFDSRDLGLPDEAKIGRALVRILYPNVNLSTADTTLAASITLNTFNCERLSMLEYDILGAIGIRAEVVALEDTYVPANGKGRQTIGHALVVTPNAIIDAAKDTVYPASELSKNYRAIYGTFSSPEALQYSTYFSLGTCMGKLGIHGKAIAYYEKAAKLAPGNPFIFYNLGQEYFMAGELEKSLDAYDKVVAIDPAFANGVVPIVREVVHSAYIQKYLHTYVPGKE